MPILNERTLDTGAIALNYAEGPENGPPVVLLHGVCRRWPDFLSILPVLSFRGQVQAIDFRGHGRSGRGNGAYRTIDYLPDVIAFLERRVSEPAVVIGHSLGAMVAAAVAAEVGGRVRAVVLEDPPFSMMGERIGETSYLDLFRGYRSVAGSDRPVEEIAAKLAALRLATPDGVAVQLGDIRDPIALRFLASCLKPLDPAVLDPIVAGKWLEGFDVPGTLRRIACPALLIQADAAAGGILPDEYAAEIAGWIPGVVSVKLAGVGHQVHGSQPEAMMRLVTGFLESLE